jgi:cysteinyl-tRNA synthetase
VTKHLGFSVDVACGGIDNLVRHHDYTLAIAEAVSGKQLSRYWLHGGHLFVNGKKMPKSSGNVYYPSDLLNKGFSGDHLRFFLIYGSYREKLNFTFEKLAETSQKLDSLKSMVKDFQEQKSGNSCSHTQIKELTSKLISNFENNMSNNLNVKNAFNSLYETITQLHKKLESLSASDKKNVLRDLHSIDSVIQCIF